LAILSGFKFELREGNNARAVTNYNGGMSMNRKIGLIMILSGLLLVTAGCGGGKSSNNATNITDTNESLAAKNTVKAYFDAYFSAQAQEEPKYSKMGSDILDDNENTQLNEGFRETVLEGKSAFSTSIKDYRYQINYRNVSIDGSKATVEVTVDLDFQYRNAAPDIKSGLYGINYDFSLKYDGAKWLITNIDSDLVEYQNFKKHVREQMAQTKAVSNAEAIKQVTQTLKSSINLMRENIENTTSGCVMPGNIPADSAHTKSVYVGCKSYNYHPAAAAEYAVTYAESTTAQRIFYSLRLDCTNFVSQCVWAGYIGFDADAIATARNNIQNKIGMIPAEWFAGTGGGSTNWENVDVLWRYLTDTTKKAGPIGDGYNNGGRYRSIVPENIQIGDVVQVKWGPGTEFDHSVFITKRDPNVTSFSNIYVSSHTNDRKNFSLQEVINLTGGYWWCYMRGIRMRSGCYMK
jgi:hypothetical protein